MNKNLCYSSLLAVLFFASCETNPLADFTAISTRTVVSGEVDLTKLPTKRVTGKDYGLSFFFIPIPPFLPPSIDDTVEDALQKGNGDLLLDAYLVEKRYFQGIIFNWVGYEIKGKVVNTKDVRK